MASIKKLELTVPVVRIGCEKADRHFYVHKSLLEENAPQLQLHLEDNGSFSAHIGASRVAVENFAYWLYTGDVEHDDHYSSPSNALECLLETYAVGEEVGCVDFMDATLDLVMGLLSVHEDVHCVEQVVNPLTEERQPDSGAWKLAVDNILHFRVGCGKCWISKEVFYIMNFDFMIEVARRIFDIKGLHPTVDMSDPKFCAMIITGYCDGKRCGNSLEVSSLPWDRNPCKYHRHKELGLQCYTRKQ